MTTTSGNYSPHSFTAAYIQGWVGFCVSALTNAGWVQTTDTGQTAAGSFGTTQSANTSLGYQIWRMNDALQSSYPVFVKFEWGGGAQAPFTYAPAMWVTVGTGSNGTGTITGILGAGRTEIQNGAGSATAFPCYASGTTSRFNILNFVSSATSVAFYVGIERSKDATGADSNIGVIVQYVGNAISTQFLPFTGLTRAAQTAFTHGLPTGLGSMADGTGKFAALPIIPFGQYGGQHPGIQLYAYYGGDMPSLNILTMNVRGTNRTYFAAGAQSGWTTALLAPWATSYPMILFE